MTEPSDFEARLSAALDRYSDGVASGFDALAVVRATRPRSRSRGLPGRRAELAWAGFIGLLILAGLLLTSVGSGRPTPTLVPRAGWIAAVGEQVMLVESNSGATVTLPDLDPRRSLPALSPDGTWVADLGGPAGSLVLQRVDGATPTTVATGVGTHGYPARAISWSPDGRHFAYPNIHPPDEEALFVADLGSRDDPLRVPAWLALANPAWSPDGALIAFAGVPSEIVDGVWADDIQLCLAAWPTLEVRCIDQDVTWCRPCWAHLSWSPESDRVVADLRSDGIGHIVIIDVDSVQMAVTRLPASGDYPTWSPSGEWIAFVTPLGTTTTEPLRERRDLWAVRPDGTDAHVVILDVGDDARTWSPDGLSVLGLDAAGHIVVASVDGRAKRTVGPAGFERIGSWQGGER